MLYNNVDNVRILHLSLHGRFTISPNHHEVYEWISVHIKYTMNFLEYLCCKYKFKSYSIGVIFWNILLKCENK